jgi:hypothetical protein
MQAVHQLQKQYIAHQRAQAVVPKRSSIRPAAAGQEAKGAKATAAKEGKDKVPTRAKSKEGKKDGSDTNLPQDGLSGPQQKQ